MKTKVYKITAEFYVTDITHLAGIIWFLQWMKALVTSIIESEVE